jgi:predicted nucleic acid-binding protein
VEPVRAVTIHLDTSVLVDALTGPRRSFRALERTVAAGHVTGLSSLVLYEWLRGPRTPVEIEAQESLWPTDEAWPFGSAEAARAAEMYRLLKRGRGRDMDIAIAACAVQHRARLWTLNPDDFRDLPFVELYEPTR